MKLLPVVPLESLGPVKLGMTQAEVRKAVGGQPLPLDPTPTTPRIDGFHRAMLEVHYDGRGTVEYAEVKWGGDLSATLDDVDLLKAPAEDVVKRLSKRARYDEKDPELPYRYVFPELGLVLWRPTVPERDGEDVGGKHFESVGLGSAAYFNRER